MSKKDKKHFKKAIPLPPAFVGISKRGKMTIGFGIGLLVIGFGVLTLTDPAGQNWASTLSPFLILGGYAVIGVGIVLPDAPSTSKAEESNKN